MFLDTLLVTLLENLFGLLRANREILSREITHLTKHPIMSCQNPKRIYVNKIMHL